METNEATQGNVVEIPKEISLAILDARLQKAEAQLKDVRENHELFMQGLEDAAKECLKNDLIRVTIPQAFRDKLTGYIAAREKARQDALPPQK